MRIIAGHSDARWHDLTESGAYEWWYFDALNADGSLGLVLIYFAGLPFSPDYLTEHERGNAPQPLDHAALFVAVYENGRQVCYALNRYPRESFAASLTGLDVAIGPNRAVASTDGRSIKLSLDTPLLLGGARISGELELDLAGSPDLPEFGVAPDAADHSWNPLAVACGVTGQVVISNTRSGTRRLPIEGTGYADHNYGIRPLTEGIRRWHWGRVHFEGSTAVYYHTSHDEGPDETTLMLCYTSTEAQLVNDPRFAASGWRRRPLCPRFPTALHISGVLDGRQVRLTGARRNTVDWGPFYMRFIGDFSLELEGSSIVAPGISEYLDPRGLRLQWLRPLIKTRIRVVR